MKQIPPGYRRIYVPSGMNEYIFKSFYEPHDYFLIVCGQMGKSSTNIEMERLQNVKYLKNIFPNCKIIFDGGINNTNMEQIFKYCPKEIVIGTGINDDFKIKEIYKIINGR